jgi:hypothetical protein
LKKQHNTGILETRHGIKVYIGKHQNAVVRKGVGGVGKKGTWMKKRG